MERLIMPDANKANSLNASADAGSTQAGDVPDAIRRRYLREGERVVRFYLDATTTIASFEDHGRRLVSPRRGPTALRDMVQIAVHRDWRAVQVQGDRSFRREAWLALREHGVEVHGYRPTSRDLQALERREHGRTKPRHEQGHDPSEAGDARRRAATQRLDVIEAIVAAHMRDPERQAQTLARAKQRVEAWLAQEHTGQKPERTRAR
jgi:hypothetical protein